MTRKRTQNKRVQKRQPSRTRRRQQHTPKTITTKPKIISVPEPEDGVVSSVKSHRFISNMTFDGDKLITETQKDNEPVKRREYTKEDLERELPIGKELVDNYLDGVMPPDIQLNKHKLPVLTNVLISLDDLGLIPPNIDVQRSNNNIIPRERRLQQLLQQHKLKQTLQRVSNNSRKNEEVRLLIHEPNDNGEENYHDIDIPKPRRLRTVKRHNLFDLI